MRMLYVRARYYSIYIACIRCPLRRRRTGFAPSVARVCQECGRGDVCHLVRSFTKSLARIIRKFVRTIRAILRAWLSRFFLPGREHVSRRERRPRVIIYHCPLHFSSPRSPNDKRISETPQFRTVREFASTNFQRFRTAIAGKIHRCAESEVVGFPPAICRSGRHSCNGARVIRNKKRVSIPRPKYGRIINRRRKRFIGSVASLAITDVRDGHHTFAYAIFRRDKFCVSVALFKRRRVALASASFGGAENRRSDRILRYYAVNTCTSLLNKKKE